MPFKKVGSDDYTSPTGRHFNQAQVRLYYANGGKFPAHAKGGPVMLTPEGKKVIPAQPAPSGGERPAFAKGGDVRVASYAAGGPVLGRERSFLKEPDRFRGGKAPKPEGTDDVFTKKGATPAPAKPTGNKSLPVVKPHK